MSDESPTMPDAAGAHPPRRGGRPRVKICGLTRARDVARAVELGADYVGVVLSDGFGRSVPLEGASDIVRGAGAERVAVLVDETAEGARTKALAIDASIIQLHGMEDETMIEELRALGDWTLWKALRPRSLDELHEAVQRFGSIVDGLLVEGWREGSVGGAGMRVGLEPRAVRDSIPLDRTFVLAGGLTPESVEGAVARFAPDVVDVSSGVEAAPGEKDAESIDAFIRAVRGARPTHPGS